MATNEESNVTARALSGAPSMVVDSFCRHWRGAYRSWDRLSGLTQYKSPTWGSNDGNAAIEVLREAVMCG